MQYDLSISGHFSAILASFSSTVAERNVVFAISPRFAQIKEEKEKAPFDQATDEMTNQNTKRVKFIPS